MKKVLNFLRIIIGAVLLISNIGLLYFHFTKASSSEENPISVFAQILIAFVILFPKAVYWGRNKILQWVFPICLIVFLLWFGGHASLTGMGKNIFKSENRKSDSEQFTEMIKTLSSKEIASAFVEKQLEILHETSQELNSKCPMKIDVQTQLDHTIAGPGLKFTYYYTLIGMPTYDKEIDKRLYEFAKNHYSSNTNLKLSIGMGVTYCNKYRNEQGTLMYDYCFSKENLEEGKSKTIKTRQKLKQTDLPLATIYSNPSVQKLNELSERINNSPNESLHHYNRGVYYMSTNDYTSAMSDFDKAIQLDNKNALAFAYRGHNKICIGDNKGAVEDCNKAISLTDFWGVFYYIRAKAYIGIDEHSKAINDLRLSAEKKYRPAKNVLESLSFTN